MGKHRTPGWLWLPVAWVFTDCVASIKLASPTDLPLTAQGSSEDGSGSSGSSGSSGGGGTRAVLVDKASLRFFRFQRGELVLLKSPEQPGKQLVRRLAALEGDWVSVGGGKVERVPKGQCWVEADGGARAVGGDSLTAWGPVPLALVEGRVSRVLWPPACWGALAPRPCPSGTHVVGKAGSLEFLTAPEAPDDWWS